MSLRPSPKSASAVALSLADCACAVGATSASATGSKKADRLMVGLASYTTSDGSENPRSLVHADVVRGFVVGQRAPGARAAIDDEEASERRLVFRTAADVEAALRRTLVDDFELRVGGDETLPLAVGA